MQCNDPPSYWIRQVRHTNASYPDALKERKNKYCGSYSVWHVSHTISPSYFFSEVYDLFQLLRVSSSVSLFSSWGNRPLNSYWSLSCDHVLHCSDELMWEKNNNNNMLPFDFVHNPVWELHTAATTPPFLFCVVSTTNLVGHFSPVSSTATKTYSILKD